MASSDRNENLKELQEFIDYRFNNLEYLIEALTTPQLANELHTNDYDFLETLGDAVMKTIFIVKLFNSGEGIRDPGKITKIKQRLENDETLKKIANKKMNLSKYVLKSQKQEIKGTKILADVFEAICGAIFLDSGRNIKLVEEKMINRFFGDFDSIIQDSTIFNKSKLIEYIQKLHRITPRIESVYENHGTDNKPKWIAKNPKVYPEKLLIKLPISLKSEECKSISEAEQDLYGKILKYLISVK
jgi:ribonuclease-3